MSVSCSWNKGAMSTPPRPASTIVITQAERGRARRVDAAQAGELLAVDHRAHLQPGAGVADHDPEHDGRDRGHREHRDLVRVEHDALHQPVLGRRRRADPGDGETAGEVFVPLQAESERVVPDRHHQPLDEVGERDEETDRPDDAGVHGRLGEAPQQDAVEEQAEQGREQEHRDDQRRDDGHVEPGVELVVEVGGGERDRAVREVEDARRDVGEHEPRREDRVDRAGRESREREAQELLHRA